MQIDLPDDIMRTTGMTAAAAREALAVMLYKLGKLDASMAGKLIGRTEFDFHRLLGEYGQVVNYSAEDLADDLADGEDEP